MKVPESTRILRIVKKALEGIRTQAGYHSDVKVVQLGDTLEDLGPDRPALVVSVLDKQINLDGQEEVDYLPVTLVLAIGAFDDRDQVFAETEQLDILMGDVWRMMTTLFPNEENAENCIPRPSNVQIEQGAEDPDSDFTAQMNVTFNYQIAELEPTEPKP